MVTCIFLCVTMARKTKSDLPVAGQRPVRKLVDPLFFLPAEGRKNANKPRHIVGANSISLALARRARACSLRCTSSSGPNPLRWALPRYLFEQTPYPSPWPGGPGLAHYVVPPLPGQIRFAELCPGIYLCKLHIIRPGPKAQASLISLHLLSKRNPLRWTFVLLFYANSTSSPWPECRFLRVGFLLCKICVIIYLNILSII